MRRALFIALLVIAAMLGFAERHASGQSYPGVIVIGGNTPVPPTATPNPTATPVPDPAATLCIGGLVYNRSVYQNFAAPGATLNLTDTFPSPGVTTAPTVAPSAPPQWITQYVFGRADNVGYDWAYYPSSASMAALWPTLQAPWTIVPGVGLDLHAVPVPTPTTSAQAALMCVAGTGLPCQTYLSGWLSLVDNYTTGFWTFVDQYPANNNAPNGNAWASTWTFSNLCPNSGSNCYGNEWDTPESWPERYVGQNKYIQQTEQCYADGTATPPPPTPTPPGVATPYPVNTYSGCTPTTGATVGYKGTIATMDTAFHEYGILVTPSYGGFFIDYAPSSVQMTPNAPYALSPQINLQVIGSQYGVTPPSPGPPIDFYVQSYAYYAPSATGCSGGMASPPPPTPTPSPTPTPNPYVSTVLSYSPAIYLQLQEQSGATTAIDSSANGYNATIGSNVTMGSSTLQSSFTNTSALYPTATTCGPCNDVSLPNDQVSYPAFNAMTTHFTVIDWIEFSSIVNSGETVAAYGNVLYNNAVTWSLTFNSGGSGVITAAMATGTTTPTLYTLNSATALSANTPHMVAITYDGSYFRLWVDPVSTTPSAHVAASGNLYFAGPTIASLQLGMDVYGEQSSFPGNNNHFAWIPSTLTGAQLEALYAYH